MFIIDFDDTLFDTHAFKEARLAAVAAVGISADLYWQTYRAARNGHGGVFTYSDRRHAAVLATHGFAEEAVLDAFKTTTGEAMKGFLFPDAVPFLQALRRHRRPMVLLSLGDPSFQELKVKGSGIDIYFDRLYMVEQSKEEVIRQILVGITVDNVWFINDKIDETEAIMHRFPELRPVVKPSRSVGVAACRMSGFACFSTLAEIQSYVSP